VYDTKIMDVMGRAAFFELFDFPESLCSSAAECGHRSFLTMAGCFDGISVKQEAPIARGTFWTRVCKRLSAKQNKHRQARTHMSSWRGNHLRPG